MIKNTILTVVILRGINSLPILLLIASLNQLLVHNGFSLVSAANLTGTILALSYCLSLLAGYLAKNFINIDSFYMSTNYIKAFFLYSLSLIHSHELTLLLLAGFISGLDIQKIAVTNIMNDISNGDDYLRRKIMVMSYAAINFSGIAAYLISFIFFHLHKENYMYFIAALSCLISTFIYNKIKYLSKTVHLPRLKIKYQFNVLILISISLIAIFYISLHYNNIIRIIMILALVFSVIYFIFLCSRSSVAQSNSCTILYLLYFLMSVIYFSVFMLKSTLLFDFIPTVTYIKNSQLLMLSDPITAIFIFIPIIYLIKKLKLLGFKAYITPILFSVSFAIMYIALLLMNTKMSMHMSPNLFVIYLSLLTLGEAFISPEGVSLAGRLLKPELQIYGIGLWSSFISASYLLSTYLADCVLDNNIEKNLYDFYWILSYIWPVLLILFLIVSIILERKASIGK